MWLQRGIRMRKKMMILAAASMGLAGLSVGCDNNPTVPDPKVYRAEPTIAGVNDPVRVTGAPIGATGSATAGVVGTTPTPTGLSGTTGSGMNGAPAAAGTAAGGTAAGG